MPHAIVANAYLNRHFDPVDALMPDGATTRRRIASALGGAVQASQKRRLATPFRAAARRLGVRGLDSLDDLLDGDLVLIADHPEFCPLRALPAHARHIGPLIWEGTGTPSFVRDTGRPLVYATTGNTGDARLAGLVVEAFAGDPAYQVVLTTGAYLRIDRPPNASNVHIARFLPGSAVLAASIAAVHCGGNGTTYQVARAGVPAVVVPGNNDQRINAYLVRRHRIGLPLELDGLSPARLRAAVEAFQALRAGVCTFGDLLAACDAPFVAAEEIAALR